MVELWIGSVIRVATAHWLIPLTSPLFFHFKLPFGFTSGLLEVSPRWPFKCQYHLVFRKSARYWAGLIYLLVIPFREFGKSPDRKVKRKENKKCLRDKKKSSVAQVLIGFESRHLSKIQNGRHKQRSGQHTLTHQKNIQKKVLANSSSGFVTFCWRGPSNFRNLLWSEENTAGMKYPRIQNIIRMVFRSIWIQTSKPI